MLQLWILDSMTTAAYDATKCSFPLKRFACGLHYKTDLYDPSWTGGRIDRPEVQQVLQDLIQYQEPFVKKYRGILWLLLILFVAGVIIFFVLLNNAFNDDTDYSDTDTFDEDLDYETNLYIGFCVGIVVWAIIFMVLAYRRDNLRTEKMRERAKQINASFAARGLRWEVPSPNCCNYGIATQIQLFKDYAMQPQPGVAPAYLPPQGSYPMYAS